jgi:hypothetical protein
MKIKITTPHITADGPVPPGSIIDVPDDLAVEYVNAKLAVAHKEETSETASSKKTKETATTK